MAFVTRNHKRYIVKRNSKGRIISFKRFSGATYKRYVKQLQKRKIGKKKTIKLTKENLKQHIAVTRKKKELFVETPVNMTNVTEYYLDRPLNRVKGQLIIDFRFYKKADKGYRYTEVTGSSFKPKYLTSGYKQAFDECYQSAMAQVEFSPDGYDILSVRYRYFLDIKKYRYK